MEEFQIDFLTVDQQLHGKEDGQKELSLYGLLLQRAELQSSSFWEYSSTALTKELELEVKIPFTLSL